MFYDLLFVVIRTAKVLGLLERKEGENNSKENHKQTPVLGEVLLSLVSVAFVHERERVLAELFSPSFHKAPPGHFCARIKKLQKMLDRLLFPMLY